MTILSTGAYDFPAAADRNRNSMMLQQQGTSSLGVLDGVHAGLALTKTTGMGFSIGPGRAAINGTSAAEGTFTCAVTASETGSFAAGHSTMDRRDLVVLKTYPNNPASSGVEVEVITGTPFTAGTNPALPTAPAGSLALYSVRIDAGTSSGNGGWSTSKVTDLRRAIGVPEFIDYTPTFGGFTNLGTGAVREGRYRIDGDKVTVYARLMGGSGALMGTGSALYFTLPVPAIEYFVYSGMANLHHPDVTGLAYELRLLSNNTHAAIWARNASGALVQPGSLGFPFGNGTEIFCSLEYHTTPQ